MPKGSNSGIAVSVDPRGASSGSAIVVRSLGQIKAAARDMKGGLTEAEAGLASFGRTGQSLQSTLFTLSKYFSAGLLGREVIASTIGAQNSLAQLTAVVKSTGGAAGYTAEQLRSMAEALSKHSTQSHENIEGAQALLLAYTKIGHNVLPGATQAVVDMSARMGDLQGNATRVGRALENPTVGLTMLRRAGVMFTDSQIAVIKHLQQTGDLAGAQAKILEGLEEKFGGAAEAARFTLGGALTFVRHQFEDTLEASERSTAGIVGGAQPGGRAHGLDRGRRRGGRGHARRCVRRPPGNRCRRRPGRHGRLTRGATRGGDCR